MLKRRRSLAGPAKRPLLYDATRVVPRRPRRRADSLNLFWRSVGQTRRGLSFGFGFGQQQAENQPLQWIHASISQSLEIPGEFRSAIGLSCASLDHSSEYDHQDRGAIPDSIGEQAPHTIYN